MPKKKPPNWRMDYTQDPPRRLTEQEVKDRLTRMAKKAREAAERGDHILAAAIHEAIDDELKDLEED
ncbi:hypothetical protein [Nonomuraea sp. NPDC001023]|uniref:hypothetical protein n=1 Tax=unclassified Nonomuraea TaxID=2593643 RepID=UPI0033215A50